MILIEIQCGVKLDIQCNAYLKNLYHKITYQKTLITKLHSQVETPATAKIID